MKKIAVVLSGCGFQDGAEVTESVSALIALSELGAEYKVFAPDQEFSSKDHFSGANTGPRNIMHEAARIARGKIDALDTLNESDFDALVVPGGFGAALHLCNWAEKGAGCDVHPTVQFLIESFHKNSKPIGAICIAPALVAKVLGPHSVTVTIGDDAETAAEIEKTGAQHESCPVDDFITDRENKVITTPAYMYDNAAPHKVFTGIRGALKELVEMA